MKKIGLILALATIAPATAFVGVEAATASQGETHAAAPAVGRMLYSADGRRLAAVYRLDANGAPQILLEGRVVTVPASTLSETDGKIVTTLSRRDLMTAR